MSFSVKIGLCFALLLTFTILVASISWFGTADSIRKQNEIYLFSSKLRQQFYQLAIEERNYSTEKQPEYSQNVFTTIASIRAQITKQPLFSNNAELQQLLDNILLKLDWYEENFLKYTQFVIDLEALESRLYKELGKLASATGGFLQTVPAQGDVVTEDTLQLMLHNIKNFSVSYSEDTRSRQLALIEELSSLIAPYLEQEYQENIQLAAFRLTRSLGGYQVALVGCYDVRKQLGKHKSLLQQQFYSLQELIELYVTHERSNLERSNFRYLLAALGVTVLSGLLALFAAFFLSRRIVVPITSLKQSAQQVVLGNLDTTVSVQSHDEIGDLSRIFNEMTEKLRRSFSHLESYKNHLETLVDKRTVELREQIREKEHAEDSLRRSQQSIQRILDQIPVGIIVIDKYFLIRQWNPAAQKIFEYGSAEALGRHASFIVADNEKENVQRMFDTLKASKKALHNKNYNRTRSGDIILCNWYNAPFLDQNNEITGIICIVEDITEKDRGEKEHLKIAKLEAAGVLAGGIAHDFNNILTAILGNINLALIDNELSEKTRKLLLNSEKASVRAKSLTEQLLTFAKGGNPIKETTSLQAIVKESASFALHGSNVSIEYDLGHDVWPVEADKGQISQVVQNIILNARHAMPNGGTIFLGCHNFINDHSIAELTGENFVHLKITDHGIGMTQDMLEKIFDPYFSTKQDGSGLGLAVTHSIVQKHDGHIIVESQSGLGTTFHIYLPASSKKLLTAAQNAVNDADNMEMWKILVMDDEDMVLKVLDNMLSAQGHIILRCREGHECLKIFEEELLNETPVDLIIMDLTIPGGMGGRETAKRILQRQPNARIIVASGYSNDPILSNFQSYGFTAALSKPFTFQEVHAIISRLQQNESSEREG